MKSLAERLIVSSGLTLLRGTAASAQVVDQPPVVGQPPVIGQPDEVMTTERRAAELRAAQPWSISLGVDELSETAVQPGVAQNSVRRGSQLDGTLNYNWALPRGNVRFNGSANQVFYHEPVKLNQTMYGVGASASYAISRRASWDVGEAVTQRYAQDLTTISDAGLLPPKLVARLYSATGGLRYDLSPRTQMRFGLAEQTVSFDSSLVTGSTSQFGGATAFTVNMTMGRQLSRSQNVVVSAEYQHTKTSGA